MISLQLGEHSTLHIYLNIVIAAGMLWKMVDREAQSLLFAYRDCSIACITQH